MLKKKKKKKAIGKNQVGGGERLSEGGIYCPQILHTHTHTHTLTMLFLFKCHFIEFTLTIKESVHSEC